MRPGLPGGGTNLKLWQTWEEGRTFVLTESTPKALLLAAQGCNAQRATLGPGRKRALPQRGYCRPETFWQQHFQRRKDKRQLKPRVARFASRRQPWAARNNASGVVGEVFP